MLIIMRGDSSTTEIENIRKLVLDMGFNSHIIQGEQRIVIGITGNENPIADHHFAEMPGVLKCVPVTSPFKLISREAKSENTVIDLGTVKIGNGEPVVIAGPCSVESEENVMEIARILNSKGVKIFRAGAFKPRTSPYSFQGRGMEGIETLQKVRRQYDMKIVTEVIDVESVEPLADYVDIFQIGARNMYNYSLLKKVGKSGKPVLLKRGLSATLEEFLLAAEYILNEGNFNVILCERGVRTFSDYSRNTLDLNIIPVVRHLSHLPIIVDPSHASGDRRYVVPLARAALAAGAHGLMVEVHPSPDEAWSDGAQTIYPHQLDEIMMDLPSLARYNAQEKIEE